MRSDRDVALRATTTFPFFVIDYCPAPTSSPPVPARHSAAILRGTGTRTYQGAVEPSHDVGLPPALYDLQGIATVFGGDGTAIPPWKYGYVR